MSEAIISLRGGGPYRRTLGLFGMPSIVYATTAILSSSNAICDTNSVPLRRLMRQRTLDQVGVPQSTLPRSLVGRTSPTISCLLMNS